MSAVVQAIHVGILDGAINGPQERPPLVVGDQRLERLIHLVVGAVEQMEPRFRKALPDFLHRDDEVQRVPLAAPVFTVEHGGLPIELRRRIVLSVRLHVNRPEALEVDALGDQIRALHAAPDGKFFLTHRDKSIDARGHIDHGFHGNAVANAREWFAVHPHEFRDGRVITRQRHLGMDAFHVGGGIGIPVEESPRHADRVGRFTEADAVPLLFFGLHQLERREGEARFLLFHPVRDVHTPDSKSHALVNSVSSAAFVTGLCTTVPPRPSKTTTVSSEKIAF